MNYILNIDTRNIDKSKNDITNFRYTLISRLNNIISIKISSFEFTNSSYIFSDSNNNNYFTITYAGNDYTFKLEDGNYTAENIVQKLNDYFSSSLPALTATLNSNSGKIKLTSSGDDFSLYFPDCKNYKSFGQIVGFNYNNYSSTGKQIVADNIINTLGEHYYFLKINDYGNIYNNGKKYMSKIILNAPKFQTVYEDSNFYVSKEHIFKQTIDVKHLDIQIFDYKGNSIDPNGIDYSFSIEFKVIQNAVLKLYKNINFRSNELDDLILKDKLLKFCIENT